MSAPETSVSKPNTTLFDTFARAPLEFERGEGAWLYTRDGDAYLDFSAGIAVNSLGHANPVLVQALTEQAQKLWHTSNLFRIPGQERLADRLVAASFADKVFFANSGAEANEAAIKTARRYHYVSGHPERFRILTIEGAFHGRTLATLAAGGQQKYLEGFGPKADGFDQVPFGDFDAIKAAVTPETAAIMIEPIQGEGGVRAFPNAFLRDLRTFCDQQGLLLIMDEVQTGIGRTGKLFAYEWTGITPDILTSAKGIGGGFPIGACLATAEAAKGMTPGTHGTTFGGNPLAMAVGNAVLDVVLADGFLDHVRETGLYLKQRLASLVDQHPTILDGVRGEGLLVGIHGVRPVPEIVAALRGQHLLVAGAGENVIRLLPPLTVGRAEVDAAIEKLDAACSALEAAADAARLSA
ncbi:aspartate aminotransferase family protein [Kaistia dalseonensis]|uniref:Acetylornithine aminotransferase n=1 Tax=Kaistia dalseonensis TaxID=410840 RepID=A0ABU0HDK2_9HYPH|nr:aspartate aminotransferase family protein [Kaistia dalseonensis]MCX5497765.1 aspartate aminotransferase family protein [Kaistia dalseonensis]MDQ0440409.1 acetylornithine/N-succinyldiaminopimelate aminotransferase [Kaistia dalseonensis]